MPRGVLLTSVSAAFALGLNLTFPTSAEAHKCVGEMHYTAEGKITVRLGANLSRRTGVAEEPLHDIQVRLRRNNRPGSELTSNTVTTDENGNFKAHGCFARDTNGVLAGGNPIEITVQARFRSDRLKLRNANLIDSNWHDVHTYADQDGGTRDLPTITYNEPNAIAAEFDNFAEIWWFYSRELDRFAKRGVRLAKRISVTYPHNNPVMPDTTGYVFGRDIFLGSDDHPGDFSEPHTMAHEFVHSYQALRLDGYLAPGCLLDAHHQPASNWRSSRCSGFMEGMAEAGARYLLEKHYNRSVATTVDDPDDLMVPASVSEMRNPQTVGRSLVTNFPVRSMDDVERTDAGWLNFFLYLFAEDEWTPAGLTASIGCSSPTDVKLFQLFRALEAEQIGMASITVRDVLRLLERQIEGFDRRDSDIYEMLVDAGNARLSNMQARVDDEFCVLKQVKNPSVNTSVQSVGNSPALSRVDR